MYGSDQFFFQVPVPADLQEMSWKDWNFERFGNRWVLLQLGFGWTCPSNWGYGSLHLSAGPWIFDLFFSHHLILLQMCAHDVFVSPQFGFYWCGLVFWERFTLVITDWVLGLSNCGWSESWGSELDSSTAAWNLALLGWVRVILNPKILGVCLITDSCGDRGL